MDVGLAGQFNAACEEPAVCILRNGVFDRLAHAVHRLSHSGTSIKGNSQSRPTYDVARNGTRLDKFTILDGKQVRTLGARFANVAPLEVAGEDYVRPLMKNGRLMHMAKGPVIVSLVDQVIERAGSIVGMAPIPPSPVWSTPMLNMPAIGSG